MTSDWYEEKRGEVFYYRFVVAGKKLSARSSGETNKARARKWAKDRHRELCLPKMHAGTLREWAGRFYTDTCPHVSRILMEGGHYSPRTLQSSRGWLVRYVLDDPICDLELAAVRRADVLAFRERLVARVGRSRTAQCAYSVLRVVLNEAIYHELTERDPCAKIGQVSYEPVRRVALSRKQIQGILSPEHFIRRVHYEATLCAAVTGLRAGEVRALSWADLDPERGIVEVRRNLPSESTEVALPKWGKVRRTAYPRILQAVLEPRRGAPDGWVFSQDGGPIGYKHWADSLRSAARKEKVVGATLHGLRHSLLTHLREDGIPDDKLKGAFGWSGQKMLDSYTHRELYDQAPILEATDRLMGNAPPEA